METGNIEDGLTGKEINQEEIEKQLELLKARAAKGENVDTAVNRLRKISKRLSENINS